LVAQEPVRLRYGSLPAEPRRSDDGKLDLKVIFTDVAKTTAALTTAREMARGLGARITLLVTQVVPYPLPLADPPVSLEFTERMLETFNVDSIEIYLCRDRYEALRRALPTDSVAIVGTRKRRWWPSWFCSWFCPWEWSLARMLRREGRRVLTV
jgi:hypothetical protein